MKMFTTDMVKYGVVVEVGLRGGARGDGGGRVEWLEELEAESVGKKCHFTRANPWAALKGVAGNTPRGSDSLVLS